MAFNEAVYCGACAFSRDGTGSPSRLITGPDYRWIMAWTVVLAPTLLLAADILGRILVSPQQLQVGIITGLAGAPLFLYLVRNRKVATL